MSVQSPPSCCSACRKHTRGWQLREQQPSKQHSKQQDAHNLLLVQNQAMGQKQNQDLHKINKIKQLTLEQQHRQQQELKQVKQHHHHEQLQ